jgi:excisionase family DNA binding protein
MDTDIITIREVAEYLKLTEKTTCRLASEGELPGFKVGGSWRFKLKDLEKWISTKKARYEEKK